MVKINKYKNNINNPGNQTPCHFSFSGGIIYGPHRGSLSVRDHLRSNLGIISGLGIICGPEPFAALYRSVWERNGFDGKVNSSYICE